MNKAVFLVLFAFCALCLGASVERTLVNECTPTVSGIPTVCVTAVSVDCYELHAKVTVDNKTYLAQDLPLPRILQQVKALLANPPPGTPKNFACYNYSAGALGNLEMCLNVTELEIDGDDLKFCGSLVLDLNAPTLGKFNQTLPIPCLDIKECKLFGCPNQCNNHGKCGTLGCDCNPGYSGPDCSIFFNGTCVETDLVPSACWKAYFPDCTHLQFEVVSQGKELFKFEDELKNLASFKLLPSTPLVGFEPCKVDVTATNIAVKNDTLNGCPLIEVSCDTLVVEQYTLPCMTLAKSSALICSNNVPTTTPTGTVNPSNVGAARVAMYVAVGLVVLALLAGGGYFVFIRFFRKTGPSPYGYDSVSTNGADDDEDIAPLRSPFGGSSDEEH